MRKTLVVAGLVLAFHGCKSQKVIAVETEISAVKARLATLEKKRQDLEAESRKLQVERKTLSQQADEAALARERLAAAAHVLEGTPIPDGIQLDEALRAKSPGLGALAAQIVQRQLPCADPDAPESDGPPEGGCSPPPLEDACEGVAERSLQSFKWSCSIAPGPLPAAVCISPADLDTDAYPLNAPTAHLTGDVVRLAYEKDGRLVVGDWPAPGIELYKPMNWSEQNSCQSENSHRGCVRTCDERSGRLSGGCDDWEGNEGPGDDEGENPEPPEVRAAREAADRAEREAAEARNELSYQECLASCEANNAPAEPEPLAHFELKFTRSPAPGLFEFDVASEQEDGGAPPPRTVLLSFRPMHAQLDGAEYFEKDAGDSIEEVDLVLDVQKLFEGPVTDGKRALVGLTASGDPGGVSITLSGKDAPEPLALDEVCELGAKLKPPRLVEACVAAKSRQEKPPDTRAAADAGVTP